MKKNLSHYHLFHHKIHNDWPGVETWPVP